MHAISILEDREQRLVPSKILLCGIPDRMFDHRNEERQSSKGRPNVVKEAARIYLVEQEVALTC